jgi:hypothetical protein
MYRFNYLSLKRGYFDDCQVFTDIRNSNVDLRIQKREARSFKKIKPNPDTINDSKKSWFGVLGGLFGSSKPSNEFLAEPAEALDFTVGRSIAERPVTCKECVTPNPRDGFRCGPKTRHLECYSCLNLFAARPGLDQNLYPTKCDCCELNYCYFYNGNKCNGVVGIWRYKDWQPPMDIDYDLGEFSGWQRELFIKFIRKHKTNTLDIKKWYWGNICGSSKRKFKTKSLNGEDLLIGNKSVFCGSCLKVIW